MSDEETQYGYEMRLTFPDLATKEEVERVSATLRGAIQAMLDAFGAEVVSDEVYSW